MHLGEFAATSATFESFHRPATGLYVSFKTTQGSGLRESTQSSLRVSLCVRAVRRGRPAASCTQSAGCGGRAGSRRHRVTRHEVSRIRRCGP